METDGLPKNKNMTSADGKADTARLLIERAEGLSVTAHFNDAIGDYNKVYDMLAYENDDELVALFIITLWERSSTYELMGQPEKAALDREALVPILAKCNIGAFGSFKKEAFRCAYTIAEQLYAKGRLDEFAAVAERAVGMDEAVNSALLYQNSTRVFDVCSKLGYYHCNSGKTGKGYYFLRKAVNNARGLKVTGEAVDSVLAEVMLNDCRRSNYSSALRYEDMALGFTEGRLLLGCAFFESEPEKAAAYLSELESIAPDSIRTDIYYEAIYTCAKLKQSEKLFEQVLQCNENGTRWLRTNAAFNLGKIAYEKGEYSRSYGYIRQFMGLTDDCHYGIHGCSSAQALLLAAKVAYKCEDLASCQYYAVSSLDYKDERWVKLEALLLIWYSSGKMDDASELKPLRQIVNSYSAASAGHNPELFRCAAENMIICYFRNFSALVAYKRAVDVIKEYEGRCGVHGGKELSELYRRAFCYRIGRWFGKKPVWLPCCL